MQWKDFISSLREAGLTQMQIAAEAGCRQNTVSDLMTGKTKEPRGSLATRLLSLGKRHGVKVSGAIERSVASECEGRGSA